MQMLSQARQGKYGHKGRSIRVYGLFGGKKDEKSEDAPSKVNELCFQIKSLLAVKHEHTK